MTRSHKQKISSSDKRDILWLNWQSLSLTHFWLQSSAAELEVYQINKIQRFVSFIFNVYMLSWMINFIGQNNNSVLCHGTKVLFHPSCNYCPRYARANNLHSSQCFWSCISKTRCISVSIRKFVNSTKIQNFIHHWKYKIFLENCRAISSSR
jgi:hypothetical protein